MSEQSEQYARMARRHWREHLPGRYADLDDPDAFFADLGQRAEEQVDALARQLAGGEPDVVARKQAEEIVLPDLGVLAAPEARQDLDAGQERWSQEELDDHAWREERIDRLVDGTLDPQTLTERERARLREGLSARMLELTGLGPGDDAD